MKIKIMMFLFLGISTASLCFAQTSVNATSPSVSENQAVNGDANVNADTNTGENTSMNGNTSTTSGGSISSTAASAESRKTSGSGN